MPAATAKTAKQTSKTPHKTTDAASEAQPQVEPKSVDTARAAARAKADLDRKFIRVRGAREHNLKNIDVQIPRDQLVVITGLSGSGKSSLAFDTIFAEGQRKYMESLSAYARQFLDQLKKPDVDEIEGIPPTIAIEQRSAASNPRSTVATTTEIYDYLRLLYARCGTPYSWAPTKTGKEGVVLARAGRPISATSSTQIVDTILGWATRANDPLLGRRMMVLAPVVRGKKGFHRDVLEEFVAQGWLRARVNGTIVDLRETLKEPGENPLKLGRYEKHTIEAVVDRLSLTPDMRQRLAEAVETCIRLADGAVVVTIEQPAEEGKAAEWRDSAFSNKFADPVEPEYALEEISPRLFSFNSPFGACPSCSGLGTILEFDETLVIPNDSLSLSEGAVAAWNKNGPVRAWFNRKLRRFCKDFGVSFTAPVRDMGPENLKKLLHGVKPETRGGIKWEGVVPNITEWWGSTENESVKEFLSTFLSQSPCKSCFGDRLRIEALHVQITSGHKAETSRAFSEAVIGRPKNDGTMLNVAEFSRLNITDAIAFIADLKLTQEQRIIAEPILKEINNRLRFLSGVGLEYLSLDRKTATLSGGEAQRIRLASQVGSGLVGACYVLDEPTIGLHQRDNDRLIATLRHLADIGNTVLVVEHDEDMIRHADHVLDVGPGPGVHGGTIVAQGTVQDICNTPRSITGDYLAGRKRIDVPSKRRELSEKKAIVVKGARANNLKNIDAAFPLGGVVCVTGVSGSGKSTLVNDILLLSAKQHLLGSRTKPGEHASFKWPKQLDRVIEVDQSPIGRTPRSNPATYTGIFDDIRNVLTATKEAKIRGYKPGRFSFNVRAEAGGGRCEACQGQGLKKIEMHFLPDVYVECEVCKGKRYNRETLEIEYRGKSIADILDMTVEQGVGFFENHPKILRFLKCLHDVGLDYLQLGQPSTTLSGGEAQRIKLATELGKGAGELGAGGHTLYILDEPTTGLHFEDIRKLVMVLNRLADAGNTLVVIEHNLDVIKTADWLVDMGPEGGDNGGRVVARGTPEDVARSADSHTGRYLKTILGV
ncbi:MAG: excinuclease ABC subunit UvrA [Planctomycetota bacterium]|nr:excinuclease ABC subunit UvrA [Planctomycetota bacterium]